MAIKIIAALILFISLLWAPFWLTVLLALSSMVFIKRFWPAIAIMALGDFIYGIGPNRFLVFPVIMFAFSLVFYFLIERLRSHIFV